MLHGNKLLIETIRILNSQILQFITKYRITTKAFESMIPYEMISIDIIN